MTASDLSPGWFMLLVVCAALALDFVFGGWPIWRTVCAAPDRILASVSHWFERKLNRPGRGAGTLRWRGALVTLLFVAVFWMAGAAAQHATATATDGWIFGIVFLLPVLRPRRSIDLLRDSAASGRGAALSEGWARFVETIFGGLMWFFLLGFSGLYALAALSVLARSFSRSDPAGTAIAMVPLRLETALAVFPAIIAWPFCALAAAFVPGGAPGAALRHGAADVTAGWHRPGFRAFPAFQGAIGAAGDGPQGRLRGAMILSVMLLLIVAGLAGLSLVLAR